MKTILIKTDGEKIEVVPKDGEHFTLAEMYKLIDCDMIQMVDYDEEHTFVFDEEGKLNSAMPNLAATKYWEEKYGKSDILVGNVLLSENKFIN